MSAALPALFIGHGSPMNALNRNAWSDAWRDLGRRVGKPRAILAVSAHWYGSGTAVTVSAAPRTIHDFRGFPDELYAIEYPAPGDPGLARDVQTLLAPIPVALDDTWGLDHGTWSVLRHMYPDADVPVVQLRIDAERAPAFHHAVGKQLTALREQGVLVLGSGNVVHNLGLFARGQPNATFDWALRIENRAKALILAGDHTPLIDYPALDPDVRLAVPTPEHYLPLLYVLGAQRQDDTVSFPVEGTEGGSLSMLSVQIGG